MAKKLPRGWKAHTAPGGNTYYYNSELGKTQWERPDSSEQTNGGSPSSDKKNKQQKNKKKRRAPSASKSTARPGGPKNTTKPQSTKEAASSPSMPATPTNERSQYLQKIIEQVKSSGSAQTPEPGAQQSGQNGDERNSRNNTPESRGDDDPERNFKKLFATYVPNVVARYKDHFGSESRKEFSKEIVRLLAEKEMKKESPIDKDQLQLSDEKRAKVKSFVKHYMDRAVEKYRHKHKKSSGPHQGAEPDPVDGLSPASAPNSSMHNVTKSSDSVTKSSVKRGLADDQENENGHGATEKGEEPNANEAISTNDKSESSRKRAKTTGNDDTAEIDFDDGEI